MAQNTPHPEGQPSASGTEGDRDDGTADPGLTDQEYETIKRKLGDVREDILREIAKDGDPPEQGRGEADAHNLRRDDGAGVKEGTLDHHIRWLQGTKKDQELGEIIDLDWWPYDVGPLVKETGRVDLGFGTDVRVIGWTETGEAFVERLLDGTQPEPDANVEDIHMAVQAQGSQLETIRGKIEALTAGETDIDGGGGVDLGEAFEDRLDELEERMSKVENAQKTVDKNVGNLFKAMERIDEGLAAVEERLDEAE